MKVVISEDLSDSGLRNPDLLRIEVCWCSLDISAWQLMALMKAVTRSTSLAQVLVLESAPGGSFCNRSGEDKDGS